MAIQSASAKLYTGIRCWVVDKNISAALTASFSLGNQNQPSPVLVGGIPTIYANIKGDKVVRTRANIDVISTVGIVNQRYAKYGGGNNVITPGSPRVIDNTNAWRAVSTVVCKFPTYFRIDVDKLQLPQGTTCTVSFEEDWIRDGVYLESTRASSPAIGNFFTFRTPWLGASFINSSFSLPNRTVFRIKQLTSTMSSTPSLVAYPIFNPGKLAALFGGVFLTLPTAVKTARGISSMVSSFASNTINLRIKQLASTFVTDVALTTDAIKYKTPGPVSMAATATFTASGDRTLGPITAVIDAAGTEQGFTVSASAVKTARTAPAITAQASVSVDVFAQKGLPVTNMIMTASLSVSADVPMVISATGTFVNLPVWYGSINATINWGDGTIQTVTSTSGIRGNGITKSYSSVNVNRKIYITGFIQHWGYQNASQFLSFAGSGSGQNGTYQVQSFGAIGITSLIAYGIDNGTPISIPNTVTDISYFYYNAQLLNPERLQYWNTANVQKMEGVFRLSQGDLSNIPIGGWNTGSVTTMRRMFRNSGTTGTGPNFNTDISGWNTSNVTDMSEMFMDTTSFNRNINSWDVGSVVTFEGMFSRSSSTRYNQNLSNWDVSSATNMSSMLFGAGTYTHDLTGWCVTNIPSEPPGWGGVTLKPIWGTCP